MRVTVLGFQSPYPGPNGATPGYLIETDSKRLLLDCGSGVLSQLGKYVPIHQLDALLLSHYHHDHIADVGVLQYGLMVHQLFQEREKNRPLPIYAPAQPIVDAQSLLYRQATSFHPVDEQTHLAIGDIQIRFLRTDHGNGDPCYAMRLESQGKVLVYGADSGPGTNWEGFASDVDLFICEGTYLDHNKPKESNGHLSVRETAQLAEALKCRALLITHLYHLYEPEVVQQQAEAYTSGTCYVASIGLQITL
ncbi:MBL fold metallo-hydrolase [Brevibacillus sp. AY1]|uniref:MBL fold metallo-hydrolase n=1 Tax=Brevibacillus sp. AY1 TaxID=2807621 RepID=UPI002455C40D|nr:MBL fold metallo-hydrolase [Brevibacillus sp. AY1]MDH4618586.1 MBL fold metallo-hydrolase [Brevibacillus sp. AY1]